MSRPGTSEPPRRSPETEEANPDTRDLDQLPLGQLLEQILEEDAGVAEAVRRELPSIERAARMLLDTLEGEGRWFNLGAGTSGRIGVLDAAELPPTFGLGAERVQAVHAGGTAAMMGAVEGAEDDRASAGEELRARGFCTHDTLLVISASGETPFVLGGLDHARRLGADTIGLTCSPSSTVATDVRCPIVVRVGPEVIAGSTRMKCGLSQKMVLQMLSTSVMVRLGRVHGNRMIEATTHSSKLRERATRLVMEIAGLDRPQAERLLARAGGSASEALRLLEKA